MRGVACRHNVGGAGAERGRGQGVGKALPWHNSALRHRPPNEKSLISRRQQRAPHRPNASPMKKGKKQTEIKKHKNEEREGEGRQRPPGRGIHFRKKQQKKTRRCFEATRTSGINHNHSDFNAFPGGREREPESDCRSTTHQASLAEAPALNARNRAAFAALQSLPQYSAHSSSSAAAEAA